MFTDEQLKKYQASGGTACPFCGSSDIVGGRVDVDERKAWQDVTCSACNKRWQDGFVRCEVADLETNEFELQSLPQSQPAVLIEVKDGAVINTVTNREMTIAILDHDMDEPQVMRLAPDEIIADLDIDAKCDELRR